MILKLFEKDITDDRFYLMVYDTLDVFVEKDENFTIELASSFAESLKDDICSIIDEVVEDWVKEQTHEED